MAGKDQEPGKIDDRNRKSWKRYAFRIRSMTNGTPFTYLVQNFASLLTAVNALSFKQESITKIKRFLDFSKPKN